MNDYILELVYQLINLITILDEVYLPIIRKYIFQSDGKFSAAVCFLFHAKDIIRPVWMSIDGLIKSL